MKSLDLHGGTSIELKLFNSYCKSPEERMHLDEDLREVGRKVAN
jgi:hypothetical protein